MLTPMRNMLPISNFSRWLIASIANIVHYVERADRAAATQLPESVKLVPAPNTMLVWREVFDAAGLLISAAAYQLKEAFGAHPLFVSLEIIVLLWLIFETILLTETAIHSIRGRKSD